MKCEGVATISIIIISLSLVTFFMIQLESVEDTTVCADSDGGEDEVDGYVLSEKEIISVSRKPTMVSIKLFWLFINRWFRA